MDVYNSVKEEYTLKEHLGADYISRNFEEMVNVLVSKFNEIIKICNDNLNREEEK